MLKGGRRDSLRDYHALRLRIRAGIVIEQDVVGVDYAVDGGATRETSFEE
jgi:hypothetical protein